MGKDTNIDYIIRHVFLPPELPQKDDENVEKGTCLIEAVLAALTLFQQEYISEQEEKKQHAESNACIKMVENMLELRNQYGGGLEANRLAEKLSGMVDGDILALHLACQNAGLIIRRRSDGYAFESFEVSPTNEAVMRTKGRLRRRFPGPAIMIGHDRMADATFLDPLTQTVAKLDSETAQEVVPITIKAGSEMSEIRDTVHPRFVTELLTGILRAVGKPLDDVERVYKHTREDVLWKSTLKPWRRSPLWLFLRVALQTSMMQIKDEGQQHVRYKSFMLFFMARVLEGALEASLPSDLLFVMTAKISRRALKLERADQTGWLEYAERITGDVHDELFQRWSLVEKDPDPFGTQRAWLPSQLSLLQDAELRLSTLRPYLENVRTRSTPPSGCNPFTSDCGHRISQCSSSLPDLSLLVQGDKSQVSLYLTDLECWVEGHLDDWLLSNMKNEGACTALTTIIETYASVASSNYKDMPEDTSLMLLNLMDLWVALDKCALHHYPLLRDYDPEFPPSLFEPLLLPKKLQMKRLFHIENYLTMRREAAQLHSYSIFQSVNEARSFAVQYFEQSPHHQRLRRNIEANATNERSSKIAELAQKSRQYHNLLSQSNGMSCRYDTRWKRGRQISYHSGLCQKCELGAQAERLTIKVHEWPLPESDLAAKAAVFELDVPTALAKWRNTTYGLLVYFFSPAKKENGREDFHTLHGFIGLIPFVRKEPDLRLQLASTVKPFTIAHYKIREVSKATEANICVPHGCKYGLHDSVKNEWTKKLLGYCFVRDKCTLKLPNGQYKGLQYAVENTTHTSNQVISTQAECPEALRMHEFYAFGTLRSGHRLQWRNIARELIARILNFSCYETHALVVQTAWQVGPCGIEGVCRESHVDLEEEGFGVSLLSALEDALGTIEGNWQGATAARTFIALATRLMSLSTCNVVRDRCARFLQRAREISLRWTRDLGQMLQEAQDEEELKNLNEQTLEMGLTCYGTFDVDPQHIPSLLKSDEDVAIVTECSIIVQDRCPVLTQDLPPSIKQLLRRHWRLSSRLEPYLRKRILEARSCIDSTISRLWGGYVPGSPWTALKTPNERWVMTATSSKGNVSSMPVHYNVLDGSLLVNGLPLTRLPRSYESHPTFLRVFGKKILDVVPSTMSGMVFEARNELSGHRVYFGMYNEELIIRAKRLEQIYELLPIHALDGDFPHAFVQDYAHWLEIKTGFVEWRPLVNAWTKTPQNWEMQPRKNNVSMLVRGSSRLIDPHSPTAKAVSTVLSPLEREKHIHIILNIETQMLEVQLPRLKLDFFLKKGTSQLESKQFRGMSVDANQSFGAMTGLVNKLVLRGNVDSSRSVIIPHGEVIFKKEGHHVRVDINTSAQSISYHLYSIDSQIGRLVDNGSLKSRLFKCYLHAVTAHGLIDELTGQTGTEEALSILESPSIRSSLGLEQAESDLLLLLAQLTPRRLFYPKHLQVMQGVHWQEISPLSQHTSFYTSVKSIFEQARRYSLFYDKPTELPDADICGDQHLLERAAIRDSTNRVEGFGAKRHTDEFDTLYVARDHSQDSIKESQAFHTATLVDSWSVNLKGCSKLLREIESWGNETLQGCGTVHSFPLGYDVNWLAPRTDFLPEHWCAFHGTLTQVEVENDKYRIMIFLSTLAYSRHMEQELVQTLLALATVPELRRIRLPKYESFDLAHGYTPNRGKLTDLARERARPFNTCPEHDLPQNYDENWQEADDRRRDKHKTALEDCLDVFADELICQWPVANVRVPVGAQLNTYISLIEATDDARIHFQNWHRNAQFKDSIGEIQMILGNLIAGDQRLLGYSFSNPPYHYQLKQSHITFGDLTSRQAPKLLQAHLGNFNSWVAEQEEDRSEHEKLQALLARLLSESPGGFERQYAMDLLKSFGSLSESAGTKLSESSKALKPSLEEHLKQCRKQVHLVYQAIRHCLQEENSITRRLACRAKMWPRLSTTSLLRHLAGESASLRDDWKGCLIEYGVAISNVQRAERLRSSIGNDVELLNELSNPGHQDWDPFDHPEWLLLEIENNLLIRRVQAQIAREMISPSSCANSIMQLNMGEGKSSVIVPMVAAALADGKKLVRIVVLKPLSTQMFHLLLNKLGGMLGRRIFHMPISRSVRLDVHKATEIQKLCEECMYTGGVLLVQPEHLLSFELMSLERLLSDELELGNILTKTQLWLESNSRDILDESDEILSVRFELIYTMGMQRAIEFSPDRWTIIEDILGLVSRFAQPILGLFPQGLELQTGCPGSFPRVRVLQHAAADKLLEMVASEVCERGLPGVPVWNLPQHVRTVLFRFLTDHDMSEADSKPLQRYVFGVESMRRSLLLLRGLIGGGVLAFALGQKRWRVNYGLDLSRTMLAVPYRAKDIPATRAEFSHPDATIVLTCLSYYHGGLSNDQLQTAFEKLLLSDHAQEEYERWVQDAPKLPFRFHQLTGINLSDTMQCSQIVFPLLRFAKGAIDFYMSRLVFPREMKEFPQKLSSSGWDIGRAKVHPTTGFSGTNDSRYILPLSINQCDLPPQLHTNAAVLGCLMRPENTFKHAMRESKRDSFDAESLLQLVIRSEPPVRVILDVGAQVLEWKNEEVALAWLRRVPASDAQAVVFFDDNNDLLVLSRDGITEKLMISPFAKQMDQCLIYLDEAHTRGTDLKLPTDYRAAVTLGPDLTKDRLVQACMRMRKLGKGQSVMFCGPMEVENKILRCSGKPERANIEVADVLQWSITQTCIHTKRCVPLWATQGIRYQRRQIAWSEYSGNDCEESALKIAKSLLEPEAQTLEDRYGFGERRFEDQLSVSNVKDESLAKRGTQLEAIRAKCREFKLVSFDSATLREEQERELSPENEQERQVERPLALNPHIHSVHPDLRVFISQGILRRSSKAFKPAFHLFGSTTAKECLEEKAWPTHLLVTADFSRTVQVSTNQPLDLFLRPVHWVVSRRDGNLVEAVVVSPWEAHELLPSIRQQKTVTLHVYSPRVSKSVRTLEDLSFCTIPAAPEGLPNCPVIQQLNIFAGQLYLRSYEEYLAVCRLLGLCFGPPPEQIEVACDGFISPICRPEFDELMAGNCPFKISPIGFLRMLVAMRRKGQNSQKSHIGRILQGELLAEEEF